MSYIIHIADGDGHCRADGESWPCAFVGGIVDFAEIDVLDEESQSGREGDDG